MEGKCSIAIVGLNALEAVGMRALLADEACVRLECFQTAADLAPFADRFDGFIVTADAFADALDFFLPRRQKTLVVRNGGIVASVTGAPAMVGTGADETEIKASLERFVRSLMENDSQQGELSAREVEVLRLIAAGKLNKEIADHLCISVNTVITHRKNISTKLGVKSASGLSLYAMMNGLI